MLKNGDFAIVILSCDKYADLWDGFVKSFVKSWPNCNYKKYLVSNEIGYESTEFINIKTGPDSGWSKSFVKALDIVKENNIFVWLEDAYITRLSEPEIFDNCATLVTEGVYDHLHFRPNPKPDLLDNKYSFIGKYDPGRPYSVNLVGFWKKDSLLRLLLPGEGPWGFEIYGSYRMQFIGAAGCSLKPIFNYVHLVEKGCWLPSPDRKLRSLGLDIDLTRRKSLTGIFAVNSYFKSVLFNLFSDVPWKLRMKALDLLKKLLGVY